MNSLSVSWRDLLAIRGNYFFHAGSLPPDTRSITGPRALVQQAFYLENLLGIAGRYPRVHLQIVEVITCDMFLGSHEKDHMKKTS